MSDNAKIALFFIFLVVIVAFVCWLTYVIMRKALKHKVDTITCFTGGLGSGKTLLSTRLAVKLYKKNLRKYYYRKKWLNDFLNFFRKKDKRVLDIDKPVLYSNIPICLDRKKRLFSVRLDYDVLLLQKRIPLHSVILIDEIGAFANQFDYKDKNIIEVFDEFIRFFRHYSQGGYIVCNDQCSQNVNLVIRRRLNKINNLSSCLVIWRFVFYYQRFINISEEIKTIDNSDILTNDNDTQDNMNFKFAFLWNKKLYDSYCYSHRYSLVPRSDNDVSFNAYKTDVLLRCPKEKEKRFYPKTEKGNGK